MKTKNLQKQSGQLIVEQKSAMENAFIYILHTKSTATLSLAAIYWSEPHAAR